MINGKKYTHNGNIEDNGGKSNKVPCFLCGTLIKYEFELQNIDNENDIIKVGCECVKKFDSELFKTLTKSKRTFLKDKKIENVLNILSQLVGLNNYFNYNRTIEYFEDRGGFTPEQILVIYKDMIRYKINFNFLDFKVKLIRNREKQQVLKLNSADKKKLSNFLTNKQKERFTLL